MNLNLFVTSSSLLQASLKVQQPLLKPVSLLLTFDFCIFSFSSCPLRSVLSHFFYAFFESFLSAPFDVLYRKVESRNDIIANQFIVYNTADFLVGGHKMFGVKEGSVPRELEIVKRLRQA